VNHQKSSLIQSSAHCGGSHPRSNDITGKENKIMKQIKAYIRIHSLDAVVNKLAQIEGLNGLSVSTVTGFGRSRGVLRFVNFETHIKIEMVCPDELTQSVATTIEDTARTGYRGDGKIYISNIEESIRIEN
jgi:nitrogen regulatory protein PII